MMGGGTLIKRFFASGILALLPILCDVPCLAAPPIAVVVDISGNFSANSSDIVFNLNPGPFPLPSLLGGSFSGSFAYQLNSAGTPVGGVYTRFDQLATNVQVFDKAGLVVYSIETSSPMRVFDGQSRFFLGASGPGNPGWLPEMPTDLRFGLFSNSFLFSDTAPPSAAALNAATLDVRAVPNGPFIELDDDQQSFAGWDLRITSFSLNAPRVLRS